MDDRFWISDADRDLAAPLLRDHFAAGRLTPSEPDERLTAALAAKTVGDLRRRPGSLYWDGRYGRARMIGRIPLEGARLSAARATCRSGTTF